MLEWAHGDNMDRINCAAFGVPSSWTQDGALFGFDDNTDSFLVINPQTGASIRIVTSFQTMDAEGLVFTTLLRDSYGEVVVDACD